MSFNCILKVLLGTLCLPLITAQVQWAIDAGSYDFDFIYNFTMALHKIHRFNSFVIFRDSRTYKIPVVARSLEQALTDDFGQAVYVIGRQKAYKLRTSIGLNNLAFIHISSMDDPMLDVVDFTLEGLHFMPMIFIFKRNGNLPLDADEIQRFFTWCWSAKIVNVALTFQVITPMADFKPPHIQNQVYNYTPYPNVTVHNLTENIRYRKVFLPKKISNVQGYTFNTPIFQDPPLVFLTPNEKHSQHRGEEHMAIAGGAGRLYHEFIHSINGTIRLFPLANSSSSAFHKRLLLMTSNKSIDIGIHPFSELLEFANQTKGSYPLSQTNACVIVPVIPEIHPSSYIILSFQPTLGFFMNFGMLFIHLLWCYKRGETVYNSIGLSILYSNGTQHQQSLPLSFFTTWKLHMKLFHALILFCYFVVQQSLLTSLTALLSTTVMGDQIETEEDFLQSRLRIMLDENEKTTYFDTELLPRCLRNRLLVTDYTTLVTHRDALNTSFAYVATSEQWRLLSLQQRNLWKKKFRIASDELCTANFFQKFPLQPESPFEDSISLFSMMVQESGLFKKWDDMSIYQAHQMDLIKVLADDQKHPVPLTLVHMAMPLSYLLLNFFVGFFILLGEIFYYQRRR